MSSVPAFVSELIRAANENDRLKPIEVRDLLFRAITTISDLREQVGIPGSGTSRDAIIDLNDIAARAETSNATEISAALLEAADMVRTLWIVLDSGTAIVLMPSA